ncbi:hypothetical protein KQJ29_28940, partial [Enterococcus sp. S181_ASV_20]|nr:hypothetical protein [Enterococcus sp. S181_ASV_20]
TSSEASDVYKRQHQNGMLLFNARFLLIKLKLYDQVVYRKNHVLLFVLPIQSHFHNQFFPYYLTKRRQRIQLVSHFICGFQR